MAIGDRHDACLLCAAERITPWYHEDDVCWVADCEICATPMVVWRWHGVDVPDDALAHMLGRLAEAADRVFDGHYVDDNMRNIPDHFHAHARPRGGFFGHGHRRDRPAAGLRPAPSAAADDQPGEAGPVTGIA